MSINISLIFPKAQVGITTPTTPNESISIAALSFSLPQMDAAGDQGLVFPAPSLVASGFAGSKAWADLDVPVPAISGTGLTGFVSTANLEIPKPTLTAYAINGVSLVFTAPSISAASLSGGVGSLSVALKQVALAVSGYAGTVSTASLILPLPVLSSEAHAPSVSTIAITIPVLALTATARGPEASVQTVLVMNTDTSALTTYSNFNFNSMAEFNGVFLGASASGIYALTGDLDEAALIAATAKIGLADFGDEHLKRAESIYVGYRADGSLTMTVTTDEGTSYAYTLERRQTDKIHNSRVKIGKGMKGRYWTAQIDNVAGANFEMDDMRLNASAITRKI